MGCGGDINSGMNVAAEASSSSTLKPPEGKNCYGRLESEQKRLHMPRIVQKRSKHIGKPAKANSFVLESRFRHWADRI